MTAQSLGAGSPVAQEALVKLMEAAERAHARAGDAPKADRTVSLRFTQVSFAPYSKIQTAAEKAACNAALQWAQQQGAIQIEWDLRAGEHAHVLGIKMTDASALAKHLGIVPRWERVSQAQERLNLMALRHPVLNEVMAMWARGAQCRNTTVDDLDRWVDAVQLYEAAISSTEDVVLRRMSIQLFSDSKRAESLMPLVDVLESGSTSAFHRDREEVASKIGLVDLPREWFMAGDIGVVTGGRTSPACLPFMACAANAIEQFVWPSGMEPVWGLLTIENKTTFMEAARLLGTGTGMVLLYTGGMPSPSWRRGFKQLLRDALRVSPDLVVMHHGDIDAGGFRIADLLAGDTAAMQVTLRLHDMVHPGEGVYPSRKALQRGEITQIEKICLSRGWTKELEAVQKAPVALEQEALPVRLPSRGAGA